jgi:hydroxyacylglutathione hydrolase
MLSIKSFVFNPFSENTYVVSDESKQAVIIDPGCFEEEEKKELGDYIAQQQLVVKYLLNTHCHIDHVLGNAHVKEKYNVPFLIHAEEEKVLRAVKAYASNYGFATYQEVLPDRFLKEGEVLSFGNTEWDIHFLPGHAPGHIGFYDPRERVLFSGDVLFEGSIGRTDLPGGNFDTLLHSIRTKLFLLPHEVVVYSGHGNTTTIGNEKATNPFCGIRATR